MFIVENIIALARREAYGIHPMPAWTSESGCIKNHTDILAFCDSPRFNQITNFELLIHHVGILFLFFYNVKRFCSIWRPAFT